MTTQSHTPKPTAQRSPPKTPNLLVVASGKGGVGKTFISITLAHSLVMAGKRVLLFDGDLGLANIDVQLGIMPAYDLGNVIAGQIALEDAICSYQGTSAAETKTAVDFHILAGKSGSGSLGSLSAAELKGLIQGLISLSGQYDYLIVDLPAGIDTAVTKLTLESENVFVVLTDEPTSLTDAYAYIKVIARHDPKTNFHIIVNQAPSKSEGQRTFASLANACRNFLSIELKLAGLVHRDSHVKQAIRHQTPILQRSPDSPAAKDVCKIAKTIAIEI